MANERWHVAGYDRSAAVDLVHRHVPCLLSVLLASRGITDEAGVEAMLGCDLTTLHNPMLLEDMDRAVRRLHEAFERGEHAAVYGDYDVDGITSSTLMASYLRSHGLECDIYIPERFEEGYGVKKSGLQTLAEKGVTLVVTVDCGVTAVEEADFAKSLGIDMIITDHHECGDQLPDAVAVINPKRHDSQYPFPSLAGVGVAFKLICAAEGCNNTERLLDEYGDLVAVGTIADVMPVIGENRVLIKCGTEVIRSGSRPGLRALCEAAGADLSKLTSQNISFLLAPRLNAAGRLGCTDIAVGLLLTRSSHEAEHLSALLCEKNRERQALESKMYDEALGMLPPRADRPVVLAMYGWHQGVAGIVASRLAEKLGVPTVMICLSDGVGRGSCRSVHGFSLYSALEQCRDLLETFGGHDMAAGLTVTEENVPALAEKLGEIYAECRDSISPPGLDVDFEVINPDILSLQDVESLSMLEPFGSCNPTPVLCLRSVTVEAVTPISGGRHTKLRLSKSGTAFDSIFFSKTVEDIGLLPGDLADAAFTPQINEFRSRRTVQLLILDIVPAGIGGHTNG